MSKKQAVIYARLSKNRDGEKSATIDYQIQHSKEIAESEGWEVMDVLTDDDLSGTKTDRPGFQRLTQLIVNGGVDWVVFQDTDRLARDQEDGAMLARLSRDNDTYWRAWNGEVDIRSAQGKMVYGVRASMDQFYSDVIGDKVRESHKRRISEGKVNAPGRMFGEQSEDQRKAVQHLADMTLEGHGLNSMCRWLNQRGFTTTRGNQWRVTSLRLLLTNPRLAGILVSKGEEVGTIEGYEPILDEPTFRKVSDILTNAHESPKRGRPTLLLTSVMVCETCGGGMRAGSKKGRDGEKIRYYQCDTARGCEKRLSVTAHHADIHVWGEVLIHEQNLADQSEKDQVDVTEVLDQIKDLNQRLEELDEDYDSGVIDRKRFLARNEKLTKQRDQLRGQITDSARPDILTMGKRRFETGEITEDEWVDYLADSLEHMKVKVKRYVDKVIVKAPVNRRRFDPRRLEIQFRDGSIVVPETALEYSV